MVAPGPVEVSEWHPILELVRPSLSVILEICFDDMAPGENSVSVNKSFEVLLGSSLRLRAILIKRH